MQQAVGREATGASGTSATDAVDVGGRATAVPPMLSCSGLRKSYGQRLAVDGVSFSIAADECYGLLGPNGAGKTTTISMLCGLVPSDEGEITINGHAGGTLEAKASVGYVPQDLALYPDLTALENLTFFGELYGLTGKELHGRIGETLELVGLADRAKDRVGTYSGGMKRRANMAAGLLHRPKLLVLDEPTVGVDPQSRNAILETVGRLGIAVLYTTHYMEEAAKLCDRIGIIDDGHLIAEGTAEALVRAHGGREKVLLNCADADLADLGELADACREVEAVYDVAQVADRLELSTDQGPAVLAAVVALAAQHRVVLIGVEVRSPNLEDVFLSLTGKELRD
jgi:ABC-2 type transport system ATP-binding protein